MLTDAKQRRTLKAALWYAQEHAKAKGPNYSAAHAKSMTQLLEEASAFGKKNDQQWAEEVSALRIVLTKVSQDINWMLNNEKLLNPEVFQYLYDALED